MNKKESIETYKAIEESGLLTQRRLQALRLIAEYGPISANEVVRQARLHGFEGNQTGLNARFSELERHEVIEQVGDTRDKVSGRINGVYALTGKMPVKLKRVIKKKCCFCDGTGVSKED